MRSYATDNNAIVLNATGNKQVSNGPNTVNIYGNKVFINGKSLNDIISKIVEEKLKDKGL